MTSLVKELQTLNQLKIEAAWHLLYELHVMGLDAQEAGRSVNSYEGSAGIKESGGF